MAQIAAPGTILESLSHYSAGVGAYEWKGNIIASALGKVVIENSSTTEKPTINVISLKSQSESSISVGDRVVCRVLRILTNQCIVDIIYVGDKELRIPAQGMIRKEDTRLSEIDKVVMHECFRPGDLVKAIVTSFGDARQYYLSTAEVDFGVCVAKHETTGRFMTPINWKVNKLLTLI